MEDSFPQLRLVSTVVLSILTYIWLDSYPPTYINVLSQVVVHLGMYAFFSFYFFVSTSAKGKLANYDFFLDNLYLIRMPRENFWLCYLEWPAETPISYTLVNQKYEQRNKKCEMSVSTCCALLMQ